MPGQADLSGERHVAPQGGAARNPGLRHDDRVGADGDVVGDHHEIVDFHALADVGLAETAPVDGGVGADFRVVVDLDMPGMGDFDVAPGFGIEVVTEAVRPMTAPLWMMTRAPITLRSRTVTSG
jgi:hypothetical protein